MKPLAGAGAYWLFTLGLIGTGMLGLPVLAGSCAYAIGEAAAWKASLAQKLAGARKFYSVLAVSVLLGVGLDFVGLNAVRMLFWSAVVNGVLAPPLIVLVVLLTNDETVVGQQRNPRMLTWMGWFTAAVMSIAAVAMFVV